MPAEQPAVEAVETETPAPVAPPPVDPDESHCIPANDTASAEPEDLDADGIVVPLFERARRDPCLRNDGTTKGRTLAGDKLTRDEKRAAELIVYPDDVERPRTRGDCENMPRPCPFVSCKYHLYLDVNETTGGIKLNHPDKEPWELEESCALDVADRGGVILHEVGALLNLTRERVRQIEIHAARQLRDEVDPETLNEQMEIGE